MGGEKLDKFLENFLKKDSIFFDKKTFNPSFIPDNILFREEQQLKLAEVLAPALRGEKTSNVFIYGLTGSGKTVTVKYVAKKILEQAQQQQTPLKIVYLNCKLRGSADTEYRLIYQLALELGVDKDTLPLTGIPTAEMYQLFIRNIKKTNHNYVFVLDEIDQFVEKAGDNALYSLTRLNENMEQQISLVGISNNVKFVDSLDPRVKSSLSEESIIFEQYNAIQIQSILRQRSQIAFKEETIEAGVIEKCAAFAAQAHGDSRRALELLRVAGEVADRKGKKTISMEDIDEAEEKIDKDRILEIITTQPKQYQLVLYSIVSLAPQRNNALFTGEVYELYKSLCGKVNASVLTQRRISDIISEFDMLGIVNAKVISKGRYGRTRDISVEIPQATMPKAKKILEDSIGV